MKWHFSVVSMSSLQKKKIPNTVSNLRKDANTVCVSSQFTTVVVSGFATVCVCVCGGCVRRKCCSLTLMCVCCLFFICTVDYRFLEDTGRFADGATRDKLSRTPRTTLKVGPWFRSVETYSSHIVFFPSFIQSY